MKKTFVFVLLSEFIILLQYILALIIAICDKKLIFNNFGSREIIGWIMIANSYLLQIIILAFFIFTFFENIVKVMRKQDHDEIMH